MFKLLQCHFFLLTSTLANFTDCAVITYSTTHVASRRCCWPLGWSDLLLFLIFENGHIAADQVYFYESIKKIGKFCMSKFSFSKNHSDLE